MNSQFQQFQKQAKKQQEQFRQQQMAAFYQQQVAQSKPRDRQAVYKLSEKFDRVKREMDNLLQERLAGRINISDFKAKLQELMIQDERGTWWMIGAETGAWYYNDGQNWVQATPPGYWTSSPSDIGPNPIIAKKGHPVLAAMFLIGGLIVSAISGVIATFIIAFITNDNHMIEIIVKGLIWLVGIIISIAYTVKIARGK